MVVTQEHKTYFMSSWFHLPHGLGEVEPTGTFCHINYININGVSGYGRMYHTLKFYISRTACCFFVREETDGVNLLVS
jgi:hypothetical protein